MILQFKDMIALSIPQTARKNEITQHVWEANKLLLECEKAFYPLLSKIICPSVSSLRQCCV